MQDMSVPGISILTVIPFPQNSRVTTISPSPDLGRCFEINLLSEVKIKKVSLG
jgi:hypothetical protein